MEVGNPQAAVAGPGRTSAGLTRQAVIDTVHSVKGSMGTVTSALSGNASCRRRESPGGLSAPSLRRTCRCSCRPWSRAVRTTRGAPAARRGAGFAGRTHGANLWPIPERRGRLGWRKDVPGKATGQPACANESASVVTTQWPPSWPTHPPPRLVAEGPRRRAPPHAPPRRGSV